ncbi:MAG: ATP-binding protein [Clostridiales bacterium]|jgi:DNA replication protein DnaC|nr:ATP-binding protein [Clostridiales bacterium]
MTNEATIKRLIEMRLTAMANALIHQMRDNSADNLSFEERIGLLVDVEYTSRKNNKLKRLVKNARFDQPQASIADINYTATRKLDKGKITRLAGCGFISEKHNIIIMGASGAGKSYIACALGMEACKQFYSVKYIRLPELLEDLAVARDTGGAKRLLAQYRKYDLLIIDEWMLVSLKESEARDVLEIVHSRHKRASTIFCSQFAPAGWHAKIGETTLADAILDRIVYDSFTIEIHGDKDNDKSMREFYGIKDD